MDTRGHSTPKKQPRENTDHTHNTQHNTTHTTNTTHSAWHCLNEFCIASQHRVTQFPTRVQVGGCTYQNRDSLVVLVTCKEITASGWLQQLLQYRTLDWSSPTAAILPTLLIIFTSSPHLHTHTHTRTHTHTHTHAFLTTPNYLYHIFLLPRHSPLLVTRSLTFCIQLCRWVCKGQVRHAQSYRGEGGWALQTPN